MILKRNLLALALASAGICAATAVHATDRDAAPAAAATDAAQDQTSTTTDTKDVAAKKQAEAEAKKAKDLSAISVTGFSKSVVQAIDIKRDADTIQDVITAADINGLPDVSISDALSRLPGVTSERIGGQSSAINIRGLSGDFIETTLNGREQAATSGSRVTQFDQYPSELINQAAVYKSPKASLIEGGVAGTVDMETVNPLSASKQYSANFNLRGSYNDRSKETDGAPSNGYRMSASFQGKFLDNTLGAAVGFAEMYQPHVADQFNGLKYNPTAVNLPNNQVLPGQNYTSEGFELQQNGGTERRKGYMATIEWRPSDSFRLKGDGFYSNFDNNSFGRGFRVKTLANGTFTDPVVQQNGAITGGTVSQNGNKYFTVQTTNDDNETKTSVASAGLNARWTGGPWTITGDVGFSRATSDFTNGVSWGLPFVGMGTASPAVVSDESVTYLLKNLNIPSLSFNRGYTNLNEMALAKVGVYPYVYKDKSRAARLDVRYDLTDNGFFSAFEGGARYSQRTYSQDRSIWEYGNDFGDWENSGQAPLALSNSNSHVVCFKGNLSSFPCFLSINSLAVLAANGLTPNPGKEWANDWTQIQSGSVDEDILAAYLQADIDTQVGGRRLDGNFGLRMVHSSQYAKGLQNMGDGQGVPLTDDRGVTSNNYMPVRRGKKYTDWLPSVNLNYHLDDDNQLRFAAAKVMSRPPLNKLLAGGGSWIDGNTYNMWGNTSPFLDPFYATQFDVSFEHYMPDQSGALSAAFFYKHIDSFIEDQTINPFDFAAAGIQVPINPATGQPYANGQYQTAVNNDKGGYVRGIELAYSQVFNMLPGAWKGLGFTGSYSYSQSQVHLTTNLAGPTQKIGLPGLSPNVVNATLFYGYAGFDTRVSVRYRDRFIASQMSIDSQTVYYAPETVVDFQASYNFGNGLSVLFQAQNLTDQPTKTYFGNEKQTGTLQWFGRQYYLGFSYAL
ncbi:MULTISPECIES: TonB-dependent receptor [Dyella]|uniref:TonB-dependent receptor n=1 Tax=Dyella TaxID=231454 RepID=UPI00197AB756|nr:MULTISPECIES: TonB-dependent receptor [Dyella]